MSKAIHLMGANLGRVVCTASRDHHGRINLNLVQSPQYKCATIVLSENEARAIVDALCAYLPKRSLASEARS